MTNKHVSEFHFDPFKFSGKFGPMSSRTPKFNAHTHEDSKEYDALTEGPVEQEATMIGVDVDENGGEVAVVVGTLDSGKQRLGGEVVCVVPDLKDLKHRLVVCVARFQRTLTA